jgi:hypothetical protein
VAVKDRRVVRFLGNRVESACEGIDPLAESLPESDPEVGTLAGPEADPDPGPGPARLARQVADRVAGAVDGAQKGEVAFDARVEPLDGDGAGDTLAVVFRADLEAYAVSKGVLVRCVTPRTDSPPGWFDTEGLGAAVGDLRAATTDTVVLFGPVEGSVRVAPAAAVGALADDRERVPPRFPAALYSKSLGRFFEEFMECFIGDWTVGERPPEDWRERAGRLLVVEATEAEEHAPPGSAGEATTLDQFL